MEDNFKQKRISYGRQLQIEESFKWTLGLHVTDLTYSSCYNNFVKICLEILAAFIATLAHHILALLLNYGGNKETTTPSVFISNYIFSQQRGYFLLNFLLNYVNPIIRPSQSTQSAS